MVPTKERNHQAIFLKYDKWGLLFDCGEGTQRQLRIAGIKPSQISKIFLSHWHGDHVLGLPGLLQTISASEYEGKLEIYGPKGTKQRIEYMLKAFEFDMQIEIEIKEISDKVAYENSRFSIEAYKLNHRIPCYGYNFLEKDRLRINLDYVRKLGIPDGPVLGRLQSGKDAEWKGKKIKVEDATYVVEGKKISFIFDTSLFNGCYEMAESADLLICEAVYASGHEEKAEEYKHLTARDAALIASNAGVKKLILTHFSQRYKDISEIEEDARNYFENIQCAYDFMKVNL